MVAESADGGCISHRLRALRTYLVGIKLRVLAIRDVTFKYPFGCVNSKIKRTRIPTPKGIKDDSDDTQEYAPARDT